MSAITDRARDFWDRISPRERRLVVLAAIAAPITIAIWLGLSIRDGLVDMEAPQRQDAQGARRARRPRARGAGAAQPTTSSRRWAPSRSASTTYLDNAAQEGRLHAQGHDAAHPGHAQRLRDELGLAARSTTSTIDQLKTFLQEVETAVEGRRGHAASRSRRDFTRQGRSSTPTLEVSTYSKEHAGEGRAAARTPAPPRRRAASDGRCRLRLPNLGPRTRKVAALRRLRRARARHVRVRAPADVPVRPREGQGRRGRSSDEVRGHDRRRRARLDPRPRLLQGRLAAHAADQARRASRTTFYIEQLEIDLGLLRAARRHGLGRPRRRRSARGHITRQRLALEGRRRRIRPRRRRTSRRRACRCARRSACR